MSTNTAPPGWHPDPAAPQAQLRWWDGARWTEHVQPRAPQAATGWGYSTPIQGSTFAQQNKFSLITGAIVAAYVFIAITLGIVFIGILPVLMSVRAVRRHEPLGPVAVGAAIVAVIIAFAAIGSR